MPSLTIFRIGNHTLPLPKYARPGDAGMDMSACLLSVETVTAYSYQEDNPNPSDALPPLTLPVSAHPTKPTLSVPPRYAALIPTGFAYQLPAGYEAQVRPRSSSPKYGYILPNAPGTIDASYHGEVFAWILNLRSQPLGITHGQRFCQLVITPVASATIEEGTPESHRALLAQSERGTQGFGSTGQS